MTALNAARLATAVVTARLSRDASRLLGRGSGSTLPGQLAWRLAPSIAPTLASRLPNGAALVAGTNGKTTTSRMLVSMLEAAGHRPVHNRAGANLLSGVTSALATQATLSGRPRGDVGVFEVDEASLPAVARAIRPRAIVLLNLFRDQLDRYGEIDELAARWAASLTPTDPQRVLVINADDPGLAPLGEAATNRVVWFGVEDAAAGTGALSHAADATHCRCGRALAYDAVLYGHLGHWRCPACGRERATPAVAAANVQTDGLDGTRFVLRWGDEAAAVRLPLPGLYNVGNALAAAAAAKARDLPFNAVVQGLQSVAAAFGRLERVRADGRQLVLWLVKNPAGFNESLRTLLAQPDAKTLVIAVNDGTADGHDVSWLWDVDFEVLASGGSHVAHIVCSGTRAYDMAVRLKYAGYPSERQSVRVVPLDAVLSAMGRSSDDWPLYVFPTYTAMLELREQFRRRGWVGRVWQD